MLQLLIAILIALGFNVQSGATEDELRAQDPAAFEQASKIYNEGTYRTSDGGGVVIIEIGGD